jgi:hypothetical protein
LGQQLEIFLLIRQGEMLSVCKLTEGIKLLVIVTGRKSDWIVDRLLREQVRMT